MKSITFYIGKLVVTMQAGMLTENALNISVVREWTFYVRIVKYSKLSYNSFYNNKDYATLRKVREIWHNTFLTC